MNNLQALRERVEKAEGDNIADELLIPEINALCHKMMPEPKCVQPPSYYHSEHHCFELIEAMLPGYNHIIGVIDGIPFADIGPQSSFEFVSVKHKTKPLAAIAALLSALESTNG